MEHLSFFPNTFVTIFDVFAFVYTVTFSTFYASKSLKQHGVWCLSNKITSAISIISQTNKNNTKQQQQQKTAAKQDQIYMQLHT